MAGADLSEVPTFMPSLEGLQAEGTACSQALHDQGLGGFPRVTEATLESQSAWVARQNTQTGLRRQTQQTLISQS